MRKQRMFLGLLFIIALCWCIGGIADDGNRKSGLFSYRLKGNGNAVITGYDWENNNGNDVYVPRQIDGYTVSEIGAFAFSSRTALIGKNEHYKCLGEEVVVILPDTIVIIAEKAFFCTKIKACTIPTSVERIEDGAFAGCYNLSQYSVDLKNQTYTTIDGVLYNKKLKQLVAVPESKAPEYTIPKGIISIGAYAFYGCELSKRSGRSEFYFPESVREVGSYAFMNTYTSSLLYYYFENVETIGDYAFCNAEGALLSWGKVSHIGDHAFQGFIHRSRLPAAFPSSLTYIGEYSFADFGNVHDVTTYNEFMRALDLSETKLTSIPAHAFENLEFDNFHYGDGSKQIPHTPSLILPTSLKEIGEYAFSGIKSHSASFNQRYLMIEIPDSVEKIGNNAFVNAYDVGIVISAQSKVKEIGDEAFYKARLLTRSIVLPETLRSLGARSFFCNLETLQIPSSVTSIGDDIIDRSVTKMSVEKGSYAELFAQENGYPTDGNDDTSWLNDSNGGEQEDTSWLNN